MSWQDIMRRVLPPIEDAKRNWHVRPHITSPYGDTNRPLGSTNPHQGVDFNYYIGRDLKFNKSHAAIRSPVDGVVTNAGEGDYGTIAIRDANGFSHEILHTHSRHIAVGDRVVAGQLIGTMGNTGVLKRGIEGGDLHVHYQLRDPFGNKIDPMAYWDAQGPVDPNPAPPAYVGEYQQYLRSRGANDPYGFGGAPSTADAPESGSAAKPPADTVRWLSSPILDALPSVAQRVTAPSVQPNQFSSPGGAPSFNDRFGNWVSSPSGSAPLNPYRVPQQPQATSPLGMVPGQPVPAYPVQPSIWGFPDDAEQPGDEAWSEAKLARSGWPRR